MVRNKINFVPGIAAVLILFIAIFVAGCNKSSNVRWVYYDETNCADPWAFTNNNEQLKNNVVNYLDGEGVKVFEIEIFRQQPAETCPECTCKTGRQYKLKIKRSDLDNARSKNFYE
jgi:hypothetical protein